MIVLLDAVFINNSGGKVLLDCLVSEIHRRSLDIHFLLDARVAGSYPFLAESQVTYLPNSLTKRHKFYKENKATLQTVLCFGNVPPTVRLRAKVYTYLHNSVLFYTGPEFPFKTALGYKLKSWIIRAFKRNTDRWLVQTEFMRSGLQNYWGIGSDKVDLYPFFSKIREDKVSGNRNPDAYYFISDGHPNKMHHHLIPAFVKASQKFPQISLGLTISSQYPELISLIEKANLEGIAIQNLGWCSHDELIKIYREGGYLIFPSSLESFGLGLVEAAQFGMPVLASNLPFVHQVIRPSGTFDPMSIDSISEAIVKSQTEILPETELLVQNKLDELIHLLEK
jgi:glycosyltransferase involved in cell wall biosynthesis